MTKTSLALIALTFCFCAGGGFVRGQSSVKIIGTFDYPSSGGTLLMTGAINDGGEFVGSLRTRGAHHVTAGFSGNMARAFSPALLPPNALYAFAEGINNPGTISGEFEDTTAVHGFFYEAGVFTTYDVPIAKSTRTAIEGINDAGDFVGVYVQGQTLRAFADLGGSFSTLALPNSYSLAAAINNVGQITGFYRDASENLHGFLRAADGTLTAPMDFPGAMDTQPTALNDAGYVAGYWLGPGNFTTAHGFVTRVPDTSISFDVPNALSTHPTGINSEGIICGYYQDTSGFLHGFLARLVTN